MTLLYINSDQMGQGDAELGTKLMRVFFENLVNSDVEIDYIVCINSAINITTKGSSVIDYLKKLQDAGAKISSCGTCLDHYNKRDDLIIGVVGTMKQTIELLVEADKVIRP
ncbi:MAG: sulfurtransferase-like selenium metabolism protein YedF [Marinilabiliaceae bacterium]|nr:sulfurtransferase-like selenium metabolism protein YedF [Marinilabiliaceae bacterium]